MNRLIFGTRGSALALAQTRQVMAHLAEVVSDIQLEERVIKTTGDRLADVATPDLPMGKGVFTAELENALLGGQIDVAVHSLKDLPTQLAPGLALGAIPPRADPRDVLLVKDTSINSLEKLPTHALIATGSERRRKQLARARPDLSFTDIRGNIDTRLRKLREHDKWHGLILAAAGLARLQPDVAGLTALPLEDATMLPAPGQGALALQIREGNDATEAILQHIHCAETAACATAERGFLHALGGGCEWPLGAHARTEGNQVTLQGIYWRADENDARVGHVSGESSAPQALGQALAQQLS